MLILASADKKLLSHWEHTLSEFKNIVSLHDLMHLKSRLRETIHATVIIHTSLPGLESNNDIIKLIKEHPTAKLLVLADIPKELEGVELIRAGALGYANTHIKNNILHEAIKVIGLGEVWVSKRVLNWLVNHCHELDHNTQVINMYSDIETLTPAENTVAKHVSNGNNNKDIAKTLNITERTVKAHLTSIYNKMGVKDRLHLALLLHNKIL